MSIESVLNTLFQSGVHQITIGTSPNKLRYVQAQQVVVTGQAGNSQQILHQAEDESIGTCFETIAKQVEHANELKSALVTSARRNGS